MIGRGLALFLMACGSSGQTSQSQLSEPAPEVLEAPRSTCVEDTLREASEPSAEVTNDETQAVLHVAIRGHAARCTRELFEGEQFAEASAERTRIGTTDVIFVREAASTEPICDEGDDGAEHCRTLVTTAWIFDDELRLRAKVIDEEGGPARIENGVLMAAGRRATIAPLQRSR
jgi:hypothetical protein